jgi:hypothetical protein
MLPAKRKSMFKALKFFYAMILLFSIPLDAMKVGGSHFFIIFKFPSLVCNA